MGVSRRTVWKRSLVWAPLSWVRREGGELGDVDEGWCSGQMRMCPGRRGLMFTRAKVCAVVWKTCCSGLGFGFVRVGSS